MHLTSASSCSPFTAGSSSWLPASSSFLSSRSLCRYGNEINTCSSCHANLAYFGSKSWLVFQSMHLYLLVSRSLAKLEIPLLRKMHCSFQLHYFLLKSIKQINIKLQFTCINNHAVVHIIFGPPPHQSNFFNFHAVFGKNLAK